MEPAVDHAGASSVGWVFSLARSGSSVTAYASAAPWNHAIADEPFGPWDRTGPPYHYPASHLELKRVFFQAGERLSPEATMLADRLLGQIAWNFGGRTGRVVVKHPHTMLTPEDWTRVYGGSRGRSSTRHGRILLIRHPLHRLNSMLWRRQHSAIGPNWDLETFRVFARRWLDAPPEERVVYEELRSDPRGFFRRIYRAWEWDADEGEVSKAVAYARANYHDASAHVCARADPTRGVVSEKQNALTLEAIECYARDPVVREVAKITGWSLEAAAAPSPALR
jgi:hypothetical protein